MVGLRNMNNETQKRDSITLYSEMTAQGFQFTSGKQKQK